MGFPRPHIYDDLTEAGKELARNPRIALLIARLPKVLREKLDSAASTYWYVYNYVQPRNKDQGETGLLDMGLRTAKASRLGWHSDGRPLDGSPDRHEINTRMWQMGLARDMLAAFAFQMFLGKTGDGTSPPLFEVSENLDGFYRAVWSRILKCGAYVDILGDEFEKRDRPLLPAHDWPCLQSMNSQGLQHLVLSDFGDENVLGQARRILFANRTVQTFFAAYWAVRWADDADRQQMMNWFPDPLGDNKTDFREFWRFVLEFREMPAETEYGQPYQTARWEALFAPLYDGSFCDYDGRPIRSTEFIYLTWDRMEDTEARDHFCSEFTYEDDGGFILLGRGQHGEADNGKFLMGAPDGEAPDSDGSGKDQKNPEHPVELSPYYLHRFCVTNVDYERFDPRHFDHREFTDKVSNTDNHPVVYVSWFDAWCYAKWVGLVELGGERCEIELPTEAQWEYACRCGRETPFTWDGVRSGDKVESAYCNFHGGVPWQKSGTPEAARGECRVHAVGVGELSRNAWGFHQLHGNVWEWCQDWYGVDYYRNSPRRDPPGPKRATRRILRGGWWWGTGRSCRSASRLGSSPDSREEAFGFRLAAVPVAPV